MQVSQDVEVRNKYGLHARPAMQLVEVASRFKADVRIRKDDKDIDGKSIMEIMMLAAERGCKLKVSADGPDAQQAVDALVALVAAGFSEE